jgi:hypothetical protein
MLAFEDKKGQTRKANLKRLGVYLSPTKPTKPKTKRKSPIKRNRATAEASSAKLNNRVWMFKRKQIQLRWLKYFYIGVVMGNFQKTQRYSAAAGIIQATIRYRYHVKFAVFLLTGGAYHIRKAVRLKRMSIHATRCESFCRVHNKVMQSDHPVMNHIDLKFKHLVFEYRRAVVRVQRHIRYTQMVNQYRIRFLILIWERIAAREHVAVSAKLSSLEKGRVRETHGHQEMSQRAGLRKGPMVVADMAMFDQKAEELKHIRPATRARIEGKQRQKMMDDYRTMRAEEKAAAERGEPPMPELKTRPRRAEEGLDRGGLQKLRLLREREQRTRLDIAHDEQRLMRETSRRLYQTMKHAAIAKRKAVGVVTMAAEQQQQQQKQPQWAEQRKQAEQADPMADLREPALSAVLRLKLAMKATRQALRELRLSDKVIEAMGGASIRFQKMVKGLDREQVYERIRKFQVHMWLRNRLADHATGLEQRIKDWQNKPHNELSVQDMRHVQSGFRRLSGLLSAKEHPDLRVYIFTRVDVEEWTTHIVNARWEALQFHRLKGEMLVADQNSEPIGKKCNQLARRFLMRYNWPPNSNFSLGSLLPTSPQMPKRKIAAKRVQDDGLPKADIWHVA